VVRACISTVAKPGRGVLTALRDAVTGNPWMPPYLNSSRWLTVDHVFGESPCGLSRLGARPGGAGDQGALDEE
jgi:hypothetical protein